MYLIKLAVAMVLAGGVQRIDSSGTKIRGIFTVPYRFNQSFLKKPELIFCQRPIIMKLTAILT